MKFKADWLSYLHQIRRREIEMIFSNCPEQIFSKALELGAGDGFQSVLISKYATKLISTDYNEKRLKKKNTQSIEYQICDAEEIKNSFKQQEFDLVFSSNLLEHLPNPEKTLQAIHTLLKDDGITIHIMPSPFLTLCYVVFYFPNRIIHLLETFFQQGSLKKSVFTLFQKRNKPQVSSQESGNNLKSQRPQRSFIHRLLIPAPHGVSASNFDELSAFSKRRWQKEFEQSDLELIAILKGLTYSGYGFGLNKVSTLLEKLGIASEYVYIAIKKDKNCRYQNFFL